MSFWCIWGKDQTCSSNISDECYYCEYFKERTSSIREIKEDDSEDYNTYIKAKLKMEEFKKKFE